MKAKTITFSINKGGVAKTTSSCAIAQVLALSNYKVLFIEIEPQKNSTRAFEATEYEDTVDFNKLLVDEMTRDEMIDIIKPTNFENISLIPASSDLYQKIEDDLCFASHQYGEGPVLVCLRDNLEKIKDLFDYIIIDTSPSLGRINKETIAAADIVLATAKTESFSVSAIGTEAEFIRMVNNTCGTNAQYKGVFFTMVQERTNLAKAYIEGIKNDIGDKYIDCPISLCNKVNEANSIPAPLFKYAPKCQAAADYIELTLKLGLIDKKHAQYLSAKYKYFKKEENN